MGCKGDIVSRVPTVSHISSDNFNFTPPESSKNNPIDKADSINIIIACDGVFDVFTADEADFDDPYSNFYGFKEGGTIQDLIDFVDLNLNWKNREQSESQRIVLASKAVVQEAFDRGSTDNISCLLVHLR